MVGAHQKVSAHKTSIYFPVLLFKTGPDDGRIHKKQFITFKNSETKWMRDLGDAVQRNPVLSIKIAVLNFIKECIHPIQTHRAGS